MQGIQINVVLLLILVIDAKVTKTNTCFWIAFKTFVRIMPIFFTIIIDNFTQVFAFLFLPGNINIGCVNPGCQSGILDLFFLLIFLLFLFVFLSSFFKKFRLFKVGNGDFFFQFFGTKIFYRETLHLYLSGGNIHKTIFLQAMIIYLSNVRG